MSETHCHDDLGRYEHYTISNVEVGRKVVELCEIKSECFQAKVSVLAYHSRSTQDPPSSQKHKPD